MAAVSRDEPNAPVYLWINPKFRTPDELGENEEAEALLREADQIGAFNVGFEMAVTWGTHERKAASPFRQPPPIEAWRCSAAVARKAGLPSSLEKMAEALNLPVQKDNKGKALIRFFSIPRKDGKFNEPRDHPEKWRQFCEYCRTDVRVEKMGDHKLKAFELQGDALATFQFDLRMNARGIPVNLQALRNAKKIIDTVESEVTAEFQKLTGLNPTQREKIEAWLATQGCKMPNMQATTVEEAIESRRQTSAQPVALRALELYAKLSYAAVKKVETMLDWACPDARMRGVLKYHGANTGRWTAGGPQIQNAKNPTAEMYPITPYAYQAVIEGKNMEYVSLAFGEPYEVLASSIRHFVQWEGGELLDADYNAIEGRVACWISGQNDILKDWADDKDLYLRAVAFVYQEPEASLSKKDKRRSFGKVVELACQFGLGLEGFIRTCAKWSLPCTPQLAARAVYEYYRPTHKKIVARWYYLSDCVHEAFSFQGVKCGPFLVRTVAGIKYLLQTLPSGRSLAYPHIEINKREPTELEKAEMENGKKYPEKRFLEITYWGQLPMSTQWGRIKLHGSLLFQHEVQAIAADIMAHGAICAEKAGMPPFALIHDQGLSLRENGRTAEDYAKALGTLPPWAKGLPLKVEAKVANFYSK